MGIVDVVIFVGFIVTVITVGLIKSRGEQARSEHGAQDYFLAGRGLTWWLVGFSLIAANISTEQFVGMSGKAADWLGMAIASYEWMAAVTLVVVAFVFLPKFLKSGIYTIPEFLEYRYNTFARTFMAITTMVILVGVPTASVIYSGAKVISVFFQGQSLLGLDLGSITVGCWIIGTLAALYVFAGGLKACAWADLIQGAALVLGGLVVAFLAMRALENADPKHLIQTKRNSTITVEQLASQGAISRFYSLNKGPLPEGKLHMKRPIDDKEIPWTALVLGLWIPNFFYWGLNQYITQRTLGSKSLAEGQKGIVFAAFLKLLIPFVVVIPGILAFNLYHGELKDAATVKNAKTIAAYAPVLYESLSTNLKPDPNDPRYQNDLETIESQLQRGQRRPEDGRLMFRFSETFAANHPQDAERIVDFHRQSLGAQAPALDRSDSVVTRNHVLIAAATSDRRQPTNVRELVLLDYDAAFPVLLKKLLPAGSGILGFVLAAIFGAVVSSLASMLNSASTIASMDLYRKIRHQATQYELVTVGRLGVLLFVLIAVWIAPWLDNPGFGGIFTFIQEFQGFISPGVLAVFLFGLLIHRAPRSTGTVGLILSPVLYGLFKFGPQVPGLAGVALVEKISAISFLDRMSLTFLIVTATLVVMRIVMPLARPIDLPVNTEMNLKNSRGALVSGMGVVLLTALLYVLFW